MASSLNTQRILNKETIRPVGLESIVRKILLRRSLLLINLSICKDPLTGVLRSRVLYYPILSLLTRKRSFPSYLINLRLASAIKDSKTNTLEPVLKKI